MGYKNSGVYAPYNRTKKLFKNGVEAEPERVILYPTSLFTPFDDAPVTDLEEGLYTVVGPEPQTSRKWYATLKITRSSTGKRLMSVS